MHAYLWPVFMVMAAIVIMQLSSILRSLRSTEAMVQRLLKQNEIQWQAAAEPSAAVKELAEDPNEEIAAIKAYREQTGLGLKEAKLVIEKLRSK